MNNCIICNKSFTPLRKDTLCCSKECNNKHKQNQYKTRTYQKPCIICKTMFDAKYHENTCSDCKGTRNDYNFKTIIHQNVCCRQCGTIVNTQFKNKTKDIKNQVFDITCDHCKSINNSKQSDHMKKHNPMFNIELHKQHCDHMRNKWATDMEFRNKMLEISKQRGLNNVGKPSSMSVDARYRSSIRMKINNPSYNTDVRARIKQTRQQRQHLYKYKKGSEHHLWTGNTKRTYTIRARLYYSWTKPIMERDKYTCQHCGKSHCTLEVHHDNYTFRDIIKDNLNGKHINDLSISEFDEFINLIEDIHKNISGITLCVECHKQVDSQRR